MVKALVIGCGNIGAMYDFELDAVLTHVKAYSSFSDFDISVYDVDFMLAEKVAAKYNAGIVTLINEEALRIFDCVSICSPTSTHARYLELCAAAKCKVVVCEKPVADTLADFEKIENILPNQGQRILVNYIRRFQPAFKDLKKELGTTMKSDVLHHVLVRYHRGFINNCSHALDLVSFLTDRKIVPQNPITFSSVNDYFVTDPTISLGFKSSGTQFHISGLSNIKYPVFEIELHFSLTKVRILEAGNVVEVVRCKDSDTGTFIPDNTKSFVRKDCIKNYMHHVMQEVLLLVKNTTRADNFSESVYLNRTLLELIAN